MRSSLLVALVVLLSVASADLGITIHQGSNTWWVGFVISGDSGLLSAVSAASSGSNNFQSATNQNFAWTIQRSQNDGPFTFPVTVRLTSSTGQVVSQALSAFSVGATTSTGKTFSASTPSPTSGATLPPATPTPTPAQCAAGTCIPRQPTALQLANQYTSPDYVIDLLDPTKYINLPGGAVSYMNLSSMPALAGRGLSLALAQLAPCGLILPHIHPRGDKTSYCIEGTNLKVGFIVENKGQFTINTLSVGKATFIPRGVPHFIYNDSCQKAVELNGYNSEDPGLLTLGIQLSRFPDEVLSAAFGLDIGGVTQLKGSVPAFPLYQSRQCLERCGLAPNPNA